MGIVPGNRIIESRFLSRCSQALNQGPFFFPFLTKVLQTPRGSLSLSNPLVLVALAAHPGERRAG